MSVTSWDSLPILLRARDYAAVMNLSFSTVKRQLARGSCEVLPALIRPYRWRKSDVRRHIESSSFTEDRRRKTSATVEHRA